MAAKASASLKTGLLKMTRVHFFLVAALAVQIIIFDAWQLITPEVVLWRWMAAGALLVGVTAVWYFAHGSRPEAFYRRLLFLLIMIDIGVASFAIYNQRGMASRAIVLYAVPLIVATVARNRTAVFATGVLCIGAYVLATVSYFVRHFNEGYKIELYGEVGFYCAVFLVLAGLLAAAIPKSKA